MANLASLLLPRQGSLPPRIDRGKNTYNDTCLGKKRTIGNRTLAHCRTKISTGFNLLRIDCGNLKKYSIASIARGFESRYSSKMNRTVPLSLLSAILLVGGAASGESLNLTADNIRNDAAAIRRFFSTHEVTKDDFNADRAVGEDEDKFSLDDLLVARADIDGDRIPELFVMINRSGYCGTAGCTGYVLKYDGGDLKVLIDLNIDNDRVELPSSPIQVQIDTALPNQQCHYIWARVPGTNAGVRTVHTYIGGYYWNGRKFVRFCLDRCGRECG